MKPLLVLVLVIAATRQAFGEERLMRGDVSGTLGWLSANKREPGSFDTWYNRSLLTEGAVGWYWTNHLKTEVAIGGSTAATIYGATPNGQFGYRSFRSRINTRRITITQQYQFRDNQWLHPYVGAGVDVVWERVARTDDAFYRYDPVTRETRFEPESVHAARTDRRMLAALSGGIKAYLTPRGFFRTDLRVAFTDRPDEVVWRFGFGIDF